jgi:polyphosphate kinase
MNYVYEVVDNMNEPLKKQLSYPEYEASWPNMFTKEESITSQCKKRDMLLFYPYHSIDPFLRLLKESAEDVNVISIKITIYRLARNSRIIDSLCNAAENGKEVTILMELKARFDEKNNIEWAEKLEQSGCNVIYGFESYKVHSKICLITRREKNEIVYITQIGTGNYNEKTAKLYTDFSLITLNQEIGNDANNFFKNMLISNLNGEYTHLMVAPYSFKNNVIELMDGEIKKANSGQRARILIKSNSLTDKDIINKLVSAAQAGVEVILLIRGICCLLPDIEGFTNNIKVISIVGRFLEHARVYCFGNDENMSMYIASADFMTRNTSRRVEIGCPILDQQIKEAIFKILETMISDNIKGRLMTSEGRYRKIPHNLEASKDSQQYFMDHLNSLVVENSKETSMEIKTPDKPSRKYSQEIKEILKKFIK